MMYLVAPTYRVAEFWAKQMGLTEFVWIGRVRDIRGRRFLASKIVYVEDLPFDFPDIKVRPSYADYNEMLLELPHRTEWDI